MQDQQLGALNIPADIFVDQNIICRGQFDSPIFYTQGIVNIISDNIMNCDTCYTRQEYVTETELYDWLITCSSEIAIQLMYHIITEIGQRRLTLADRMHDRYPRTSQILRTANQSAYRYLKGDYANMMPNISKLAI